jgi:hypothetical protein
MTTQLYKSVAALCFLILFSGAKAFGYHVVFHEHTSQVESCVVCDKVLVDQFSPLDHTNPEFELTEKLELFDTYRTCINTSEIYTEDWFVVLFSRPPPSLR